MMTSMTTSTSMSSKTLLTYVIIISSITLIIYPIFRKHLPHHSLISTSTSRKYKHILNELPSTHHVRRRPEGYLCDYSLFYNKPPKTASTYIQRQLIDWGRSQPNRLITNCGGKRDLETNLNIRDCLPVVHSECVVFSAHVKLNKYTKQLIHQRLKHDNKMITSTRYAPHRIVSLFLQLSKLNLTHSNPTLESNSSYNSNPNFNSNSNTDTNTKTNINMGPMTIINEHGTVEEVEHDQNITVDGNGNGNVNVIDLNVIDQQFQSFISSYNPWSLYNYHTGEFRNSSCPLTMEQVYDIYEVASNYDIVLDVNLLNESNSILKHFNLFQFTADQDAKRMVRGTYHLNLSDTSKQLLESKLCVENHLHKALLLRMASVYESVTGSDGCVEHGHLRSIGSCFEAKEREILQNNSWIL